MLENIIRKVVLFPFECFDYFAQSIFFPSKVEKVAPRPVRKLLQENAKLKASIHTLTDLNVFLQHQLEERDRHHRYELEQKDRRWRAIVRDLQRQLSLERVT